MLFDLEIQPSQAHDILVEEHLVLHNCGADERSGCGAVARNLHSPSSDRRSKARMEPSESMPGLRGASSPTRMSVMLDIIAQRFADLPPRT